MMNRNNRVSGVLVTFALMFTIIFMMSSCNIGIRESLMISKKVQPIIYKYYNSLFLDEKIGSLDAVNLKSYERVSENEILSLYIDKNTSYIALVDKRNGKVWYSVSPYIENDIKANEESKPLSLSTLSISYIDQQSSKFIENYTNSILQKNFTIDNIESGVRIAYRIENATITAQDIPHKLSNARFKQFFVDNSNLTDVDKIRTKKYFTYNETAQYWQYIADDEKLVYMADIMQRVQYTSTDLAKDNEEFNIKTISKRVFFNISVEYTIQNESMIVDIPTKDISYKANCPPLEISVLQNFGATLNKDNGYIFVPDGSGALIRYSGNQNKTGIYKTRIYGQDLTIPVKQNSQSEYHPNFPVFGMKAGNAAYIAIIEDADALAYINAVRANTLNSYNAAFSSFIISENQNVNLGDTSTNTLPITQKNIFAGDIKIRYSFLSQLDSDYSGMARYYRNYLIQVNKLNKRPDIKYKFNLELLGAIEKEKSFLGFNYSGIENLTTFQQATEIIDELKKSGINDINVKYSGWINNGLDQNSALDFEIVKSLGSKSEFNKFNESSIREGINVFYDFKLLTVPQNSKNFWKYNDSAKALDNSLAQVYNYDIVTGQSIYSDYIVSLKYLNRLSKNIVDKSKKLKIINLSLNDLGSSIYSDFDEKNNDNRQSALIVHKNSLDSISKEFENIMLNNANAYAINSGNIILDAPLTSSDNKIFDETIPFYTMVLHGLADYSGSPMNLSENTNMDILKCIETGAQPYFCFMYAEGFRVRNTKFTYLYSNNFKQWFDTACETYKKLNSCLGAVQNRQIISHKQVEKNLYKIVYEGGYTVYVNYNENAVKFDDVTVKGKDCKLIGGGN